MPLRRWLEQARPLPGAPAQALLQVRREDWLSVAGAVAAAGGRLLALWTTPAAHGRDALVRASFVADTSAGVVELSMPAGSAYPGLHDLFPAATRMQRAAFDLTGVRSTGGDERPWLAHGHWRSDVPPLAPAPPLETAGPAPYEFVPVAGDGVHEIAVGPVHAGIIEPGHFRFSVVGEKVLKLEERLGYVHKGIERRFTELPILDAHRLAARVSGDSAVAFSWAYCQALEGASGAAVPARAAWLRALYLEIERAANHLGDLGALGNDAGFAFGLAQFSRLKEQLLRSTAAAFGGARYLFDAVVPGGAAFDLDGAGAAELRGRAGAIAAAAAGLRDIYDNHAGVRDRFVGAGRVEPALAARLGLLGLAGRASGQAFDARVDRPTAPYDAVAAKKVVHAGGDVAARVAVRFEELAESCRLIAALADGLPGGRIRERIDAPPAGAFAAGLVEGWRGPCFVGLDAGEGGAVARCHPHDVSWQNWPVLEHAIVGNIVPDFPLINKSFNLSYSGHDL
jgi:Ni,Fe-hydrogenase III large subunit